MDGIWALRRFVGHNFGNQVEAIIMDWCRSALLLAAIFWGVFPATLSAQNVDNFRTIEVFKFDKYDPCYAVTALHYLDNDTVKVFLSGTNRREELCPENKIFEIEAYSKPLKSGKLKILDASGFNGKFPDPKFTITIPSNTHNIYIVHKKTDSVRSAIITLESEINQLVTLAKAETSEPAWLKSFNQQQSVLSEKKSKDKTPPLIKILSPVPQSGQAARVDTYTSFIRGKVTDDSGVMNILVAGRRVGVTEDGTFASKVKLTIGRNEVLVQAEDINGNVAAESVTIIREEFIPEQILADVDLPPKTRMNNPDALGVVIGVESYQYVPDAAYAYNDAEVFREYLAETMGMKRQRIKLATNTKATQAEFSKLLGPTGWLARNVVKGKSDIVVYFSGHGIASPDAKSSGLLPFDVDPNYSIGLPINQLYQDLASMGARSVTVFLDACFTGQTRNEEMLIANSRPIVIRPDATTIPQNVAVISAASGSQISGAIEEKEHGIFTYYVLKGIGGDADANKDGSINLSELDSYVSANVKDRSAADGREQVPEFVGDGSAVIVRLQ